MGTRYYTDFEGDFYVKLLNRLLKESFITRFQGPLWERLLWLYIALGYQTGVWEPGYINPPDMVRIHWDDGTGSAVGWGEE